MLDYLNHTDVKVLYGGIDAYAQPPPNGGGFALESAETAATDLRKGIALMLFSII